VGYARTGFHWKIDRPGDETARITGLQLEEILVGELRAATNPQGVMEMALTSRN
jgi:hypothetical protein